MVGGDDMDDTALARYKDRMRQNGATRKDALLRREKRYILDKIRHSQSYFRVLVNGEEQFVSIANSDNLNEKTIFSMPDEELKCGSYVYWMDNYWLITEKDANTLIYTKCKMLQCNHLLKWVNKDGEVCEMWSVVEDGTKYLTGEYEDKIFMATRGDMRLSLTIARTKETSSQFCRQTRFIIDDPDSPEHLAFALTKPLRRGSTYPVGDEYEGVYKFVLQEVVTTADDDLVNNIADYYKYHPEEKPDYSEENASGAQSSSISHNSDRGDWL